MHSLQNLGRRISSPAAIDDMASGIFWSWNLIFLAFMLLGFAPNMLPDLLDAVTRGLVPAGFLAWGIVLVLIPVLSVCIGRVFLSERPRQLFAMGYGVEAPLMMLVGLRFFAVRQMTAAVALLILVALAGILTYFWQLADDRIGERAAWIEHLRVIGLTLLLCAGLYAAIWIAFYALPIAANMLRVIAEMLQALERDWRAMLADLWQGLRAFDMRDLRQIEWLALPVVLLGLPLMTFTATLVVGMPVTISLLYLRSWWRGMLALATRYPRWRPAGLALGTALLLVQLFGLATRQPQHEAFARLASPPANAAEAQALLDHAEEIRKGLLNAYLAPQRYASARGEVQHIVDMYSTAPMDLGAERAEGMRELYERLASPLLYQPIGDYRDAGRPAGQNAAFIEEPALAAERYAAFFDAPIEVAERPEIVRAVQSTWDIDQAQRARLAVDDREVHLESQAVTVDEHGDWAEIELHETYRNQTFERQELVYWFSLPESAAVTGLWLGESDDRALRHAYRVAPRGAAQQIYREEVQRRVDPALIEQIGPRQYRLRVFPIEARRQGWDGATNARYEEPAPVLHLWLSYRVLAERAADGSSHWPMPSLAQRRNLYWDAETRFEQNGVQVFRGAEQAWLPDALPAREPVAATSHRFDLPDGRSVLARPVDPAETAPRPLALDLALVLDSSRSMAEHASAAAEAIAAARALTQAGGGTLDLYLATSAFSGEPPRALDGASFDPTETLYFGGQNAAELILQYQDLAGARAHDAVIILTDGSGYALGEAASEIRPPEAPIWLVHLGGALPLGYDDGTLEAIQASGGGIAGSLSEAVERLSFARRDAAEPEQVGRARDIVDGYRWSVVPRTAIEGTVDRLPGSAAARTATDGFSAIAARRWILAEMQAARAGLDRLESLDALHAIAVDESIVTPYSSMIVLVDQRQARRLDALEGDADRFERELEAVGETEEAPLAVTGVPEPEAWMLLILTLALLWWQHRSSKRLQPALAGTAGRP